MRSIGVSLLLFSATYAQILFPDDEALSNPKPNGGSSDKEVDELLFLSLNINNRLNFNTGFASSCHTPAGERGRCGSLSQCPKYLPFVRQLNIPSVSRFFRERICRLLVRSVHVCCPLGRPILPFGTGFPQPQPQPLPQPQPQPLPQSKPQPQPLPQPQPQPQPSSIIPTEAECGLPGAVRIIGGTEVQPGFWPWLAAVGHMTLQDNFFPNCGGTLITFRHVLTAAHCFGSQKKPDIVRLGEHHLENNDAGERPEDFRIVNRRSHDYNNKTNENDIALLTLDRDVVYNDFIRPACLPFKFRKNEFVGQSLTVVGWGRTSTVNRRSSEVPMEVDVPVVQRSNCTVAYQRLKNKPVIDSRQLCAGVGGQDSCNGDSGGPLNYLDLQNGRYYLVGIVSFGVGCARSEYPGVYTRVSSFLEWIQQNIQ